MEISKGSDLVSLNSREMVNTGGGLIFVNMDFVMWAYTELKKGIHDGYHNK